MAHSASATVGETPVPKAVSLTMTDSASGVLSEIDGAASASELASEIGRIKPKPVCQDETMRKAAMSPQQLTEYCFPKTLQQQQQQQQQRSLQSGNTLKVPDSESIPTATGVASSNVTVVTRSSDVHNGVSSGSSTASNASTIASWDLEHVAHAKADAGPSSTLTSSSGSASGSDGHCRSPAKDCPATPRRLSNAQSERINKRVLSRKESRNGRKTQRWHSDSANSRMCRLVTGCVPIVAGGKVMFVSASRKPEWILPKGGWEQDELMEESAIRESFEEAGVVGVLGSPLQQIEYETRKSKKRRSHFAEVQKRKSKRSVGDDSCSDVGSGIRSTAVSPVPETEASATSVDGTATGRTAGTELSSPTVPASKAGSFTVVLPVQDMTPKRIPDGARTPVVSSSASVSSFSLPATPSKRALFDDSASVASETSTYSHVRMTLFPLYVTEVKAEWPESGRFRTVVGIDEAIVMCKNRPEFQRALIEVKRRNLHLPDQAVGSSESPSGRSDVPVQPSSTTASVESVVI